MALFASRLILLRSLDRSNISKACFTMPSSTRLLRFRKEHLKLRLQNPRGNFVLHFKVHDRTVNDENLGRMRAITAHCDVSFQERLHQRCVTDIAAAATTTLLAPLPVPVPLPAIAALERSCRGLPYTLFRCHALYGYRLPADRREQSSQGRWQSSRRAAGLVEGRDRAPVLCTCGCTQTHCIIVGLVRGNVGRLTTSTQKKVSCGAYSDYYRQRRRSVSFRTAE